MMMLGWGTKKYWIFGSRVWWVDNQKYKGLLAKKDSGDRFRDDGTRALVAHAPSLFFSFFFLVLWNFNDS